MRGFLSSFKGKKKGEKPTSPPRRDTSWLPDNLKQAERRTQQAATAVAATTRPELQYRLPSARKAASERFPERPRIASPPASPNGIADNVTSHPISPPFRQPSGLTENNLRRAQPYTPRQPVGWAGSSVPSVRQSEPAWDTQSRASSAGMSGITGITGISGAGTAVSGATLISTVTAPAGPAMNGGTGRMRMMLPSPARRPSRANSVAGDYRLSADSPGLRFPPGRSLTTGNRNRPSSLSGRSAGMTPRRLDLDEELVPASFETDNVKVFVRTRPVNQREVDVGGAQICVEVTGPQTLRVAASPNAHSYAFDSVCGDTFSQEALYNVAGKPIVDNCLNGFNSCIFAYGQTGAGKTFTMLGSGFEPSIDPHSEASQMRGLIPRVFEDMFSRVEQLKREVEEGATRDIIIRCSFLEIYNEVITDLINPEATHLTIREDNKRGVSVEKLSEHVVDRMSDVAALLEKGQLNRKIGETMMNSDSSRSHSVFTAILEFKTTDDSGITHVLSSRLNLVDLAGSERQRQSQATGDRLKEASGINSSLTTLGRVIGQLAEASRSSSKRSHMFIPYRDSKISFLLKDSLGGNAKTIMIANISPAAANIADTVSTLRFAQRVKAIKNTVYRNEDTRGDAGQLRLEIRRLKAELHMLREAAAAGEFGSPTAGGRLMSPASTESHPWASPQAAPSPGPWQEDGVTMQALQGALRREESSVKEVRRLAHELEALQALLRERDSDLQRVKMILKLKEGLVARLEKQVNDAEEFSFASGEKEAIIVELKEEARILKTRMENNPEVKRHAAENVALTAELARYQQYVDRNEREALMADIDAMRAEILRLSETVQRLSAAPEVREVEAAALRAAHDGARQIENAMAAAADKALDASEVAALRTRLWEEETAGKDLQAQLQAATATREALEADKSLLQTQLSALEAQMARSAVRQSSRRGNASDTSDESPLEALVKRLNTEVEQLRTENAHLQAANVTSSTAASALNATEALNASLMAENGELRHVNAQLRGALVQREEAAASSAASEGAAPASSSGDDANRLRAELASVKAELAALQQTQQNGMGSSGHASSQDVVSLQQQLFEAEQKTERLQSELDRSLQQAMAAGIAARSRDSAATAKLQQQVAELQAQLAQRDRDVAAARQKAQSASSEVTVLQERALETRREAEAAKATAAQLLAEEKRARSAQAAAMHAEAERARRLSEDSVVQAPRTPGSPAVNGLPANGTPNGVGRSPKLATSGTSESSPQSARSQRTGSRAFAWLRSPGSVKSVKSYSSKS